MQTSETLQASPAPSSPDPERASGKLVQVPATDGVVELTRLRLKPKSVITQSDFDEQETVKG